MGKHQNQQPSSSPEQQLVISAAEQAKKRLDEMKKDTDFVFVPDQKKSAYDNAVDLLASLKEYQRKAGDQRQNVPQAIYNMALLDATREYMTAYEQVVQAAKKTRQDLMDDIHRRVNARMLSPEELEKRESSIPTMEMNRSYTPPSPRTSIILTQPKADISWMQPKPAAAPQPVEPAPTSVSRPPVKPRSGPSTTVDVKKTEGYKELQRLPSAFQRNLSWWDKSLTFQPITDDGTHVNREVTNQHGVNCKIWMKRDGTESGIMSPDGKAGVAINVWAARPAAAMLYALQSACSN